MNGPQSPEIVSPGSAEAVPPVDRAWAHIGELARISETPDGCTRTFASPAMREAAQTLATWMNEAGLHAQIDGWMNVFGCSVARPERPVLVLGSHYDSVRQGGRFDGVLGILAAVAAVENLGQEHIAALPFDIEVAAFSEEEGVRFPGAYLGSRAALGCITQDDLHLADRDGILLRNLIPEAHQHPHSRYAECGLAGYVEVHMEQGPVLEKEGCALGVVDAVAGQSRFQLTISGQAAHAGTCPMRYRRDALAGAAEFVLLVEKTAVEIPGLVATVGSLEIPHAASNVIPGSTQLSLEVRHAEDFFRAEGIARMQSGAAEIFSRRGLSADWLQTLDSPAVACDSLLRAKLRDAVCTLQEGCPELTSGAGHDAVVFGACSPMAILFVRCKNGLSHHPDESVSENDFALAVAALTKFLEGELP